MCLLGVICEISNDRSFPFHFSQIRVQYTEKNSSNQHKVVNDGKASPCRFFVNGSCNRGNKCPFSHSLPVNEVKGPTCKFFFSLQVSYSMGFYNFYFF